MGLFGGGIFGGLFSALMGIVDDVFADESGLTDEEIEEYNRQLAKLRTEVSQLKPYAKRADESYQTLLYNNLNEVPAIDKYDGNYTERLELLVESASIDINILAVESSLEMVPQIATEISVYLNEETSDLDRAKLWDSKFIKGVNEHIPPHLKKGETIDDDIMSSVMEAFRNWASFGQVAIDMYGSQRLINATYEAVEDGLDAMDYMSEILNIDQVQNSMFGGDTFEHTIVPYAGFFSGGFFF